MPLTDRPTRSRTRSQKALEMEAATARPLRRPRSPVPAVVPTITASVIAEATRSTMRGRGGEGERW
jgi:hypothetical protein